MINIGIYDIISIIQARKNLTSLFDGVINDFKIFTVGDRRRNQKKLTTLISTDIMRSKILEHFKLSSSLVKVEAQKWELAVRELNLKVTGTSKDDAVNNAVRDIKNFVADYMKRTDFFARHPVLSSIYPNVLRLYYCETEEEVKQIIYENIREENV